MMSDYALDIAQQNNEILDEIYRYENRPTVIRKVCDTCNSTRLMKETKTTCHKCVQQNKREALLKLMQNDRTVLYPNLSYSEMNNYLGL